MGDRTQDRKLTIEQHDPLLENREKNKNRQNGQAVLISFNTSNVLPFDFVHNMTTGIYFVIWNRYF